MFGFEIIACIALVPVAIAAISELFPSSPKVKDDCFQCEQNPLSLENPRTYMCAHCVREIIGL